MKYIFLLFCISCNSFYFEKVLKGAEFASDENLVLFILPVEYKNISKIKLNSRVVFQINQKSEILAIYDGKVIQVDKKLGYVKIQANTEEGTILVRYFDLQNTSLKEGDQIKKGDCIGFVEKSFSIQVMINEIIVNFLEHIPKDQRKKINI